MTTITMPTALNQALSEVAQQSMAAAAQTLATEYGFDLTEAMRHLNLSDVKLIKKRGPSPKTKEEKEAAKAAKKEAAKDEKKKAKKKGKSSSDEDDDKPKVKRGKTGYLLFADEVRAEVKAELTELLEDDAKLLGKDVIKEIAVRWKALDEEEQEAWKEQAKLAAAE